MAWYIYLAYFGAGLFLTNSIPHFVRGVCGLKFQSPFANPPGKGESSPMVNVLWGFTNLVVGYSLMNGIGAYRGGMSIDALLVGAGMLLMAIFCAFHFGKVRGNA